MRKSRNVIILVVVLAVLVGSYIYLTNRPQDDGDGSADQDEKIEVLKFDKGEISRMELKSNEGALAFKIVEK